MPDQGYFWKKKNRTREERRRVGKVNLLKKSELMVNFLFFYGIYWSMLDRSI